jgi:hypothetical protein
LRYDIENFRDVGVRGGVFELVGKKFKDLWSSSSGAPKPAENGVKIVDYLFLILEMSQVLRDLMISYYGDNS